MAIKQVDLRSDTVTLPTEKMRQAMARAEVGDSQKREDSSVNRLQEMSAAMLGKDAAIFLPSGTMSNLSAIMAHCSRGEEAVVGQFSHTLNLEYGGISAVAGVVPRMVSDITGAPDPADVEAAIQPRSGRRPHTAVVCLENTHNRGGGIPVSPERVGAIAAVARRYEVSVHMDGARLFNAAVALKVDAKELVREVDSVCFCVSKGLSAPMGSVLLGSREFIKKAEYAQYLLGGAMRQAGHMAAAGIVALEEMIDRLEEDHQNARRLGELIVGLPAIRMLHRVETNIIFLEVDQTKIAVDRFVGALAERGVKVDPKRPPIVRMLTHRHISREDVEYAAAAIKEVVTSVAG